MSRFTDLVGCELPVQLAPMGGVGTTELAAAVAVAGGFGMVPSWVAPAPGACGVNFLVPFLPALDAVTDVASQARVVEFFFGDPDKKTVAAVHGGDALAGWQVGSVAEAVAAEDAACDYVVAQGVEAGGHVRGTTPLDDLIRAVTAAVGIPVVAAGGVATAERVRELTLAGADAVRVGTRFIATPESCAHPAYVKRLLEATGSDTVLTTWFSEGWADAPHRVLRSAVDAAGVTGWRQPMTPDRSIEGDVGDRALYAGMGVGAVRSVEPAAVVVADLVRLL